MPLPQIVEGVALRYPGTGPSHDGNRSHIHIVVGVDIGNGDVCLVPICSLKSGSDKTCVLDSNTPLLGLTKPSFVGYYASKKAGLLGLKTRIEALEITYIGVLPPTTFSNIKVGIEASPETEPWFIASVKKCK